MTPPRCVPRRRRCDAVRGPPPVRGVPPPPRHAPPARPAVAGVDQRLGQGAPASAPAQLRCTLGALRSAPEQRLTGRPGPSPSGERGERGREAAARRIPPQPAEAHRGRLLLRRPPEGAPPRRHSPRPPAPPGADRLRDRMLTCFRRAALSAPQRPAWPGCYDSMQTVWSLSRNEKARRPPREPAPSPIRRRCGRPRDVPADPLFPSPRSLVPRPRVDYSLTGSAAASTTSAPATASTTSRGTGRTSCRRSGRCGRWKPRRRRRGRGTTRALSSTREVASVVGAGSSGRSAGGSGRRRTSLVGAEPGRALRVRLSDRRRKEGEGGGGRTGELQPPGLTLEA